LEPLTITLEEAIPLIQEKLELEKNKYIKEFDYEKEKIQILNGPY
jgi:topoisomerase IA-like protein